jgi:hypothetical protein
MVEASKILENLVPANRPAVGRQRSRKRLKVKVFGAKTHAFSAD